MSDWRDDALCAQIGPDLFFVEGKGSHRVEARQVCARCPVAEPCLEWALTTQENGLEYGIYGGKSARERKQIALERRRGAA